MSCILQIITVLNLSSLRESLLNGSAEEKCVCVRVCGVCRKKEKNKFGGKCEQ